MIVKLSPQKYRLFGAAFIIFLITIAAWLFFPPYSNLNRELSAGNFTASELFDEFVSDPTAAYIRFGNKVVILEGEVAATGDGYVLLGKEMRFARCIFRKSIYDKRPDLKTGERVTLKGVCRGLNMTEVYLTHCILIYQSGK